MPVLGELHPGLRRLRLLRRRGRTLRTTAAGSRMLAAPDELDRVPLGDLGAGEPFVEMAAGAILLRLTTTESAEHDALVEEVASASARGGWRAPDASPPDPRELSWVTTEVRCRGQAYDLLARVPGPGGVAGRGTRARRSTRSPPR